MRTVVMDPNGQVYEPAMIPTGTMLPVASYITKAPSGEVVLVAVLDPARQPMPIWNMVALDAP